VCAITGYRDHPLIGCRVVDQKANIRDLHPNPATAAPMGALDLDLTPKTRLWEWRWRYAAVSLAARGPQQGNLWVGFGARGSSASGGRA
jgi:hypothetical protein